MNELIKKIMWARDNKQCQVAGLYIGHFNDDGYRVYTWVPDFLSACLAGDYKSALTILSSQIVEN